MGFEHMTYRQFQRTQGHPRKKPKNVYRGKRNRDRGKEFERILINGCTYYWEEGIAKIEQLETPLRIVKDLGNGKYLAVKTKQSGPDFQGPVLGGKSVYFEAKHTDDSQISSSVMLPHQWDYLNDYYELGALVFVMLSFGLERFYRIPWWVWKDMQKLYHHKHLKQKEIAEFEVPGVIGAKKADQMVFFLEHAEDIPLSSTARDLLEQRRDAI